ncbi:MAG: phage GP46 family protein [Clostridia bacterium]|nr:phage GP46 family protein [Clostridia bacterium]
MENRMRNGDYVPDGFGGFVRLQDLQALLQRALFKLQCRRGSFPFLPELGSRLHELGREKPAMRQALAKQFCAEALEGMELTVTDVKLHVTPDDHARLEVFLAYHGEQVPVEVTI